MNYRKIFKEAYGDIPLNHIVHHLDHNRENNSINNLVCIHPTLHRKYHADYSLLNELNVLPFDISKISRMHSMGNGTRLLIRLAENLDKIMEEYVYQQQVIRINEAQDEL